MMASNGVDGEGEERREKGVHALMVCIHSKDMDDKRTRASALKSSPPSAGIPDSMRKKEGGGEGKGGGESGWEGVSG